MKIGLRHCAGAALIAVLAVSPLFRGDVSAQDARDEKGLKVTILLYSGRPDPSFRIEDEAAVGRLKDRIGRSKPSDFAKDTVTPSILGYKGVVVENVSRTPGVPAYVAVYRGNIEVRDGRTTFLRDENGELEESLLKQGIASKAVDRDLLKAAGVEIGTWPTPEKGN